MPSESTKWAALLLKRRLDSAASQEERQSILRDIERSRKDPVYRQKLGDIAQWGRFSSGPHLGAQMALGALTAAGFVPGLHPLGILGGAGLAAYGAVNIGEAIQRREEDLPWKAQTGFGAADILLGPVGRTLRPVGRGASGILRGLRGVKPQAIATIPKRTGAERVGGVFQAPGIQQTNRERVAEEARRRGVHPEQTRALPGPGEVGGPATPTARGMSPSVQSSAGQLADQGRLRPGDAGWLPETPITGRLVTPPVARQAAPKTPSAPLLREVQDHVTPAVQALPPVVRPKATEQVVRGVGEALPSEIAKGNPRFGANTIAFNSDIDKALYIVRNKARLSKGDEKYMQWLRSQFPGESDDLIRSRGDAVLARIKEGNVVGGQRTYADPTEVLPSPVERPPTPAVETVAPPPALPTKVVSDIGEGPFDTAVTQIMSSLGQTGAHLVPAMMWWRQVFREAGEKVTRETLSDIMFAKSLADPQAARFFANPLAHRPTGGVQEYTALKRGLLRELPATRKTELGRRPPGKRIAEEAKIENVKKKAEEYYPTLTRPEQAEALKELRTSNSLKNPRARLKLEVEGKWRTPRKTDPEYADYKLTLSSIALKNRFQSVLKILKEQGVLAPESEARLQNLIHEAYLRAQHGFPSSGARFTDKSGRNFLVGRVGGTGKYRAHDEIKNLDEIDLDALSASERKALDVQLRPMEAIPEFINYLGPILKSLGVLFAGIFTAEQLMPERGLNAAAG